MCYLLIGCVKRGYCCHELFFIISVHPNGDRTVVDKGNFHVGTKFASAYFLTDEGREGSAEVFVKRYGDVGTGGTDVARAVALLGARHEGELTHDKGFAVNIHNALVHHSGFVVKDAEGGNFFTEPVGIFLRVGGFYSKQN